MECMLKRIINKPINRLRLIGAGSKPDDKYLMLLYNMATGKRLELNSPEGFNEKLQYMKLNDHNDKYTALADKLAVREYAYSRLGEDIMPEILGVYQSFDEAKLDKFLHRYVLKCTHGQGAYVTCRDTYNFDRDKAKQLIDKYMSKNFYAEGREYPYKNIKPQLIAETYIDDPERLFADDYCVLCFGGKPMYIVVESGKTNELENTDWFDTGWEHLPITQYSPNSKEKITPPKKLDRLLDYAAKLSEGLDFVRVDFFIVQERIYFSELTFYPDSGLNLIKGEWEKRLGDML